MKIIPKNIWINWSIKTFTKLCNILCILARTFKKSSVFALDNVAFFFKIYVYTRRAFRAQFISDWSKPCSVVFLIVKYILA